MPWLTQLRRTERLDPASERLCFVGAFAHAEVEAHGRTLRTYLHDQGIPSALASDVFSVFVEATQNIQSYGRRAFGGAIAAERDTRAHGVVVIARREGQLTLFAANAVRTNDVAVLRERIASLEGLDAAALKLRYKQQLKAPAREDGSAGLGLISMARTASGPLGTRWTPLDEDLTLFTLRVSLASV
ncbi:MAG: SiaB family protein kinase [Deltaproteobacteria bacterium]|nr:SiaB family protein kinase [Deltaproteobacteria bacterium]